ncbi:MarR family winged helix-turn-helix transcriptional regulator [Pseudotabrizicola sp. L79]|uniref:MarR family winged helix-turn-helix transcriptional regulator n=1 Tax=Pseudotabrizicola sp. L79 TaxID=3118402 RepID=UPI002F94A3DE
MGSDKPYKLDEQIGFILRRATQRHLALFSEAIPVVTTTQFAVLARLQELGPMSQNHLGRETAMDAATIKGVVGRLAKLGFVETSHDPNDRRRVIVALTPAGHQVYAQMVDQALAVSDQTLAPLTEQERARLLALLSKLV